MAGAGTEPASPSRAAVEVGRVVGAHGLRGQLRVHHYADDPEDLTGLPSVCLVGEDGARTRYGVARAAPGRPGELRVLLVGVSRREEAEALCGQRVLADPGQLREPAEGEYYGFQVVGCRVESESGREIGTVTEIWSTGAPQVLVVTDRDGREHLVPAAAELLLAVDIEARRIVIDAIPGLIDPDGAA